VKALKLQQIVQYNVSLSVMYDLLFPRFFVDDFLNCMFVYHCKVK